MSHDPFTLDISGSSALSSGFGLGVTAFGGCCHVKFLWLERPTARGYSGDTGRNFPCIESFEPIVANCLRGAATGRNRKAIAGR